MKNILIICNYFAPDNEVAAIRITKFAKYLKENGYEITVITESKQNLKQDEILKADAEGIKIIYASNSPWLLHMIRFYKKIIKKPKNKRYENMDDRYCLNEQSGNVEFYPFETAHPVIGSVDYIVELARQYNLFLSVKKALKLQKQVDCCFSSYGGYFSIFAGIYFKKNNPGTKWIFDIRDAVCQKKFTPKYVWRYAAGFEKKACCLADMVTTVTRGLCSGFQEKYGEKVYCITNGFDRSDRRGIIPHKNTGDKLVFAYTGAMYGGLRDMSAFFSCLRDLQSQGNINLEKISIDFAGKQSAYEIFESQARKYDLQSCCVNRGSLTRKGSLSLQMESDILLVCAWDFKADYAGILTGKALEYMTAGKPVIAVINGDAKHNELAAVIRGCCLGMVYEQSNHAGDYKLLKEYIYDRYTEFEQNGRLSFEPDGNEIGKYDYKILTDKLVELINRT